MDFLDSVLDNIGVKTEETSETNEKLYSECKEAGMDVIEPKVKEEQHKIFYGLTNEDRHVAVQKHIVPQAYKDSAFDIDKIKENIRAMFKHSKGAFTTHKLNEYEQVCNGILSAIRMKKLPARSYLIGAPNGFGKTSFVYESLITLNAHGFRVAPYISLSELAQLRDDNEKELLNPKNNVVYKYMVKDSEQYYEVLRDNNGNEIIGNEYVKRPDKIENIFSFRDYINSDCLFTFFTEETAREIESYMLSQILQIRGAKGLPTIVMMSKSLDLYLKQPKLKQYIWDEILAYSEKDNCYDRIYHVSCYKMPRQGKLGEKGENIESDTGIVN